MAKAKEYATRDEAERLKTLLSNLKDQTGTTFYELSKKLNKPCTGGTLQQRVSYPGKQLSKNLYSKIIDAINEYNGRTSSSKEDQIEQAIQSSMENIHRIIQGEMNKLKTNILEIQINSETDK